MIKTFLQSSTGGLDSPTVFFDIVTLGSYLRLNFHFTVRNVHCLGVIGRSFLVDCSSIKVPMMTTKGLS